MCVDGLRVEGDDERLVLGVDQVIRARGSDLADLGRARRGGERDGLRTAVDLEDDSVRVLEKRAAKRGQGLGEQRVGRDVAQLCGDPAAQAEPARPGGLRSRPPLG